MANNQSQSPSPPASKTPEERIARLESAFLELLAVLDVLASGLPAIGSVASAKTKVKDLLARFRSGR